ncbi:MAG: hypothetical protein QM811_05475 [Pirellulales bacterium]
MLGLVFAATWGVIYALKQHVFLADNPMQIYHLVAILPGPVVICSLAGMALFEIEPVPAFFMFVFYLVVSILFRVLIGLEAFPVEPPVAPTIVMWTAGAGPIV